MTSAMNFTQIQTDLLDENEIPTFIILRRILLTAWLASHFDTPTGQELGPTYTDGTVVLAEKYLRQYG